jgi:hypothetical protein
MVFEKLVIQESALEAHRRLASGEATGMQQVPFIAPQRGAGIPLYH